MKFSEMLMLSIKDYEKNELMISLAQEIDKLLNSKKRSLKQDNSLKNQELEEILFKELEEILFKMNQIYLPLHITIFPSDNGKYEFQTWRLDGNGVFNG